MGQKLLVNSASGNLLKELTDSLETCDRFYFGVAFVNFSGVQLLLDTLKEAEKRGIQGKIMTSTYLNFTDPKALERLKAFDHIDLRVFVTDQQTGFHTKAYIFEYEESYKIIIGSSNVTQSALKSNVEWNVEIISKKDGQFVEEVLAEYEQLWQRSTQATAQFLHEYEELYRNIERMQRTANLVYEKAEYIVQNSMQRRAIENLTRLRDLNEKKALVVAATGTGKTYMAAFDVQQVRPVKLLFLVHREDILQKAKETFETLLPNIQRSFGVLTGTRKDWGADYLFANIRTLANHYEHFSPDEFDYIIVDEAHHATAPQYEKVLAWFQPKFMLGMTATPERSDQLSVFELFDHNVALEVRLHEALEDDIVAPFHYFGITDIAEIDLQQVRLEDTAELAKKLQVHKRVDFIMEQMNFYGNDGQFRKGLGFCVNREHAAFMAEEFTKRGIPSLYLSGDDNGETRAEAIQALEDEKSPIEFLFTVDIFNEGVDIPSVNQVLMLRPTQSPIVFIQQLGRGLRKHSGKQFLTVLDFIGNHAKSYLIAVALNGQRYYDKESLKVAVATGFAHVPGATHIQMDEISQKQILEQIDQESFYSMAYLKEQYMEFKKVRHGKPPYKLMDYYTYDGAPDPVKFIQKEGSYLSFLAKVETDDNIRLLLHDQVWAKVYKELSKFLPLKRPHEASLYLALMHQKELSWEEASYHIRHWVEETAAESVRHAIKNIANTFLDQREKDRFPALAEWEGEKVIRTSILEELLQNKEYTSYLTDLLEYGLHRYEREFGKTDYGIPFFKLHEQYQMRDAALLSNASVTHSSFRGSGLLRNDKDLFLFVDLHKEADTEERLLYKDEILSPERVQWESPNNMAQHSGRGQSIIRHKELGNKLHLFVRKYKHIEGNVTEPFIYLGELEVESWQNEKPVMFHMKLHHRIPPQLYRELTEKV
ncbi:DEAD/DEAH box helicase [Alkalicoccus daliensis]|uniref:Helicase conserved C-terminal domain-containing protein n=1 Tax=Alkalicoccus daliensis TaxID=745820 RepID=A0A1H0FTZ0_9BACI|nr:DEAD/DEAH box helicase [Alkalicoccus daliensis]SDN98105.1 Helicase conserved C-terminal domain-containing protein [Alkalicoccus daliensis]